MFDKDIDKMDFKELRNAVQLLYDAYERMRRDNADAFSNIGIDNFDGVFTKEYNSMKAQVSLSADAFSTYISRSADLENAVLVSSVLEMTDPSKTYKIQELSTNGSVSSESYYYFNSLSNNWEKISGDSIYTVFKQTADGFLLRGNTVIDGKTTITRNLVLSGNVTWDMDNSPVLSRYSSDNINWHSPMADNDIYMQMSFDGGNNWSNSTKVVGTDGSPGTNGTDATVTTQAVFNALTNDGATQGLFSAFSGDGNKLFINAEYIKSGQLSADRIDTNNLYCTKLYAQNNPNGYSVRLFGDAGDFGIFNSDAIDSDNAVSEKCMFGVYNAMDNITFCVYGNPFLLHSGNTTFPQGTWDFSSCDVVGLDSTSVVAVFG